ncbi:MAG: AAA family ATPase, partial [Succinivibrio sp.]|nr:AAA family ATPase [Succinivibrio sp.]
MTQLQPLSLGADTFEDLRKEGSIYVDKTGLLGSFLTLRAPVFISRPRRFGKSLLCSTLRSFFTHGIEYFKGLELEQWWNEQPENVKQNLTGNAVLYIDFFDQSFDSVAAFKRTFKEAVVDAISAVQPDFEVKDNWDARTTLRRFLLSREMASVVLLIDEYDAPITHFLDKPHELWRMRNTLDNFYRMLKSQSNRLRFFFLTGVSRVTKIGVFSGFNNVQD